jgi:hypothetical protein
VIDAGIELRRSRGELAQLDVGGSEPLLEDLVIEILDLGAVIGLGAIGETRVALEFRLVSMRSTLNGGFAMT